MAYRVYNRSVPEGEISPATHTWTSSGYKLENCRFCKKQTTGRVKAAGKGRESPLCSDCANRKGFR